MGKEIFDCAECGQKVFVEGSPDFIGDDIDKPCTNHYELVDQTMVAHRYGIPFGCSVCGSIWSKYRPLRDIVVIWAFNEYPPEMYGSFIVIPEIAIDHHQSDIGMVLRKGPGYFDRDVIKFTDIAGPNVRRYSHGGTRKPVVRMDSIHVGDVVAYDKTVPWSIPILGLDHNPHQIIFCGALDVFSVVEHHDLMYNRGDTYEKERSKAHRYK